MMANFMYGVPEETLSQIMNVMDIHLWTTGGEGFGLTGLETMATGAVNVATNYTTPPELFQFGKKNQCGLPIKVLDYEMGNAGVDRAIVDVEHAYGQMKWLRENKEEMIALRNCGLERARRIYDWDVVVKRFDEYLRDNL